MSTGIVSHFRAGTGAVLMETREEQRFLRELQSELPEAPIYTVAAPGGPVRDSRTGKTEGQSGLVSAYAWLAKGPGRICVCHDWHMLVNAPLHWRALIEALPGLRQPAGAGPNDLSSLIIFVAPHWDIAPVNPLRGSIPILRYAAPDRTALKAIASSLHKLNGESDAVADALCGLSADTAEQAAAECLAAQGRWDPDYLRAARRQLLREAGLEIWPSTDMLGGLAGLRGYIESEVTPWIRDTQLSVRRLLMAGVPGVGKSYCARWLAGQLKCECARLSIPALKAGLVGQSEANLRRALRALDALGAESPIVVVLDEVDSIARDGLDGGTSSGMFSELLTWLQESSSQAIVIATLNHLDKLDAALESRFQARFFFDLPGAQERISIASIHYHRLGCENVQTAAESTGQLSEGFSSREIAEQIIPSVARRSARKPDTDVIRATIREYTPSSQTQAEQLAAMRRAASSLRRANDPAESAPQGGRKIKGM